MINLNIALYNPFIKEDFKILFYVDKLFSPHKAGEIQLSLHTRTMLELTFNYSIKCDHAGVTLTVGLFGLSLNMTVYDTRHWDDENGKWYEYS